MVYRGVLLFRPLTNPTEAIRALDDDEKSTLRISEGGPEVNIINEAGAGLHYFAYGRIIGRSYLLCGEMVREILEI
jgi:hypothetical protein